MVSVLMLGGALTFLAGIPLQSGAMLLGGLVAVVAGVVLAVVAGARADGDIVRTLAAFGEYADHYARFRTRRVSVDELTPAHRRRVVLWSAWLALCLVDMVWGLGAAVFGIGGQSAGTIGLVLGAIGWAGAILSRRGRRVLGALVVAFAASAVAYYALDLRLGAVALLVCVVVALWAWPGGLFIEVLLMKPRRSDPNAASDSSPRAR